MLMFLVGALLFNNLLEIGGLISAIATWIPALELSRWPVFLVIVLIYLGLGCILESLSIILLTVPVFFPVVAALGFDAVWFGVVIVVITEIALITPPIGLNIFVLTAAYRGVEMTTVFRGIVPFLGAQGACLALFVAVPDLVLFLPGLMG